MNNMIEHSITELQELWKSLTMESVDRISLTMQRLARDPDIKQYLETQPKGLAKGLELYRGKTEGFILLSYSEERDTYRAPHNHGHAWVVYVVVAGEIEMGNYFAATKPDGSSSLVLTNREILKAGDLRAYLPGEIHDTRCISEHAAILRLTSLDLKEEERTGRMMRYKIIG